MHPAYSVIVFTTASGAGYGLLILLALSILVGESPGDRLYGALSLGLAVLLITTGLGASLLHLGHPERAWRAMSQWRSSWLSREGVCALLSYPPLVLLGLGWVWWGSLAGIVWLAALLAIPLALATVICTGMIYASLRTVPAWHQPLTVANYLALALASGAVLQVPLLGAFRWPGHQAVWLALLLLALAFALKCLYWWRIDRKPLGYSREQAMGLPGVIRQIEPPHSQPNFVMREMGYRVARKHRRMLRLLAVLLGFLLPALCLGAALLAGTWLLPGLLASLAMAVGLLVERWLFFAEAVHVVSLYYDP